MNTPGIAIYPINGMIFLNSYAVKNLGLEESDGLEFGYEDGEWYVRKSMVDGLLLRKNKHAGLSLSTSSTTLTRKLLAHFTPTTEYKAVNNIRIPLATQPTVIDNVAWYALLFSAAKLSLKTPQS